MRRRFSTASGIVLEALAISLVAAGLALAANALSPRGLALTRNYFPSGTNSAAMSQARVMPATNATNAATAGDAMPDVDQRLKEKGLQPVSLAQVEKLFGDPGYKQGQIVFVDARNEEEYKDGHIPGAWQLNPYHPERELAEVIPACQGAAQVVVYCTGGECEDADSTALLLRDSGLNGTNLFVYGGGFDEWTARHRPIEHGARNSGDITK